MEVFPITEEECIDGSDSLSLSANNPSLGQLVTAWLRRILRSWQVVSGDSGVIQQKRIESKLAQCGKKFQPGFTTDNTIAQLLPHRQNVSTICGESRQDGLITVRWWIAVSTDDTTRMHLHLKTHKHVDVVLSGSVLSAVLYLLTHLAGCFCKGFKVWFSMLCWKQTFSVLSVLAGQTYDEQSILSFYYTVISICLNHRLL